MTQMQEVTTTTIAPFLELATAPGDWWKLPLKLRQRWWAETDFGKTPPTPELVQNVRDVLDGKPYSDPDEQPPPDQNNDPATERDKAMAAKQKAAGKTL
jgi:hypothetical protein